MKDFDGLIRRARKQAKVSGLKPSAIIKAITTARKGK
jgi:hypothetical protein